MSHEKSGGSKIDWRRVGHIPVLIILQVIFIILFAKFVVYNPDNAYSTDSSYPEAIESLGVYPSKDFIGKEWQTPISKMKEMCSGKLSLLAVL
jgi:hypothetical protein